MNKTEQDIEKEKDAVAKMVGAKSAMQQMLDRHDRLVTTLKFVEQIALDLGKRVGEDLMINTYYHGDNGGQAKCVSVRSQITRISDAVKKVT